MEKRKNPREKRDWTTMPVSEAWAEPLRKPPFFTPFPPEMPFSQTPPFYPTMGTDLARDNLENDLPDADRRAT